MILIIYIDEYRATGDAALHLIIITTDEPLKDLYNISTDSGDEVREIVMKSTHSYAR